MADLKFMRVLSVPDLRCGECFGQMIIDREASGYVAIHQDSRRGCSHSGERYPYNAPEVILRKVDPAA